MDNVIPFERVHVSNEKRAQSSDVCSHHNIRLDPHGGIVGCRDCCAALSPFWALTMLADQYALALRHIEGLELRVSKANALILDLSAQLDGKSSAAADAE